MRKFSAKKIYLGFVAFILAAVVGTGMWLVGGDNFKIEADSYQFAEIVKLQEPGISKIENDKIIPQPFKALFSNNIAKAELINSEIKKGIKVYPAIRGTWSFEDASVLAFTPENDWMPGSKYKVKVSDEILAPEVKLKQYEFDFAAPKFSGKAIETEFYEDPRNRKNKSAVVGFEFSYPLDEKSVKNAVKVVSIDGQKYDFTYKLADMNRKLYVISAPLKIGQEENFVIIRVSGVKNSYNNQLLARPIEAKVKVPGIASFFNIKSITTEIVKNRQKNDMPEQVLKLNFTTKVEADKLAEYTQAFYSNMPCYDLKEKLAKVNNDKNKVEGLKPLELRLLPQKDLNSNVYEFKYNLNERGKCLLAVVKKGLTSVDDFMLTTDAVSVMPSADYPLEAKIAYSGVVLPLKGRPVLEFSARGVKELQVKLARIEADDLNNLVTQTGGRFASPYFLNYNFNEYNMAQVFERKIPLNMQNPAELDYASLDLKPYLGKQKGIFIVSVKGMFDENNYSPEDKRLVVVTDLGIVVKDNLDNSHDIFVASISGEKPVRGAKVEVLGRNGLAVFSAVTDASGHVKLPDLNGFENEKQPVAYKVSLDGDISYLPVNRYDLRVNYSKFAVGGIYIPDDKPDGLNAYIFSDRGIYRPGEKVNMGIVLRQNNLDVPAHLPLEIEIMNPRGETAAKGKMTTTADGLAEYAYRIPAAAATGFYNLTLYRRDEKKNQVYVASGYFRVEEFEADTMKLKLAFAGKTPKGWLDAADVAVKARLANLYGNPAVGHQIKGTFDLFPGYFYFDSYKGYHFDDPLKKEDNKALRTQTEEFLPVDTNENGEALFKIDLEKYARGTYHLSVKIDGMEAGSGRGVSAEIGTMVSPNKYLIGYKADGDLRKIAKGAGRSVRFVAIDNDLRQIEKSGLTMQFKRRKQVSNLVEMPNGTYRYQVVPQEEMIKEETFVLPQDGKSITLNTAETGEFVVYLTDGEQVVCKVEYEVGSAPNAVLAVDKDASLVVKLDEEEYAPGDIINMEIAAPYTGYGLVTIERDGVNAYKWFKADGLSEKVSIRLPEDVEGNAYVNVAWFRSLKSDEIFMPPMSFAVVPFNIDKTARKIKIDLQVPEKVRPGDKLIISYKASMPAQMILWGVNEGVLQVADYQTPSPEKFFMEKKALRVVTAQIMDMIMPDMAVARFLKAPGGGMFMSKMMREAADMVGNANPFARKLNEITAFWSGIITADTQAKEFVYEVPETFSGQIRVMALAVNAKQFGNSEKSVLVRGDFAIVPSGPFAVTPGDEFSIGVGLTNLVAGAEGDYKIKLKAASVSGLKLLDDAEREISLAEGKEQTFVFKVRAEETLGTAEIRFDAEAVEDASKHASMPYYTGIRPAVPYMTDLQMGYQTKKLTLKDFVLAMYPQYRVQNISASASPLVLAEGMLKYLDKFEHHCTEQTISRIYPAVEVMFKHPELVNSDDVYKNFNMAIQVLTERQKLNGGFSIWPSSRLSENKAVSLYAAEFLIAADQKGMAVPRNLLACTLDYVRKVAEETPADAEDINPARAAYLLTKAGEVTTNYLLNLEKELVKKDAQNWKNSLSAAYLAASYKMLRNEPKAISVLGKYRPEKNGLNDLRYVYLVAEAFPEQFKIWKKQNVEMLLKPLENGRYNTWNAAYAVLAMNAFGASDGDDKDIAFEGVEGKYKLFAEAELTEQDKNIGVVSEHPFFYVLRQQGYRKGALKAESNGIEISKEYLDKDGKAITSAKLGDEIEVVIKLRSLTGDDINDVAVVDLLPGGTDIIRDSISADPYLDFSEMREDRALAYMTITPRGNVVRYRLKAISRGNFATPPAYGEALYNILLKARGDSGRLIIE